jgi:hypothetical protein
MARVIDGGCYESEDEIPEPVAFIMGGNLCGNTPPRPVDPRGLARELWLDQVAEEKDEEFVIDNLQALCEQWEREHHGPYPPE